MPSIFIWKSDSPNSSNDFIRCYLGSNWILEDNDNGTSLSYQLIQQQGFDYNNYSILVNNAKLMPIDWIGSELLEVIQCPYQLIKSDKYAKYELIGEWNRVTLSNTLELSEELCKIELDNILKWINNKNIVSKNTNYYKDKNQESFNKTSSIKYKTDKDNTKFIPNNVIDNIQQIESFEEAILKLNNITKEQLIGINLNNSNLESFNQQITIFNDQPSYNSYDNSHKKHHMYNKNKQYNIKIVSDNVMSIPLCKV